jgi:protein SCO1/2
MANVSRRQLFGGSPAGTFAPPDSGPEVMRKRFFPNVPLITHEGKHVKFYEDLIKGKIVVLNLMYADCTSTCPLTTSNLKAVQKILSQRVRQDIFFYSLTIKPQEDTPEKLRAYRVMHGVEGNWTFLTGKPGDLELLREKLGYRDPDPAKDKKDRALHSGVVRYGNEPLSQWSSANSSASAEWIADEICFVVPHSQIRA